MKEWEEDFEDFWWQRGKYKDRKYGIQEYKNYIKRLISRILEGQKEEAI